MMTEALLPPYTAVERSRELRHRSRLLLHRAKRARERSMVLRNMPVHLCTVRRQQVLVATLGRSALQPVNVYEASLRMGA
jgi:hypothetical protein